MASKVKNYAVMEKKGSTFVATGSIYKGSIPSAAANKLARLGMKDIYIRETGKKTIRHYKGRVESVKLKTDTAFKKAGQTVKVGKSKYVGIVK